ncbi:MAG: glycosyltransferase family 2 protein [Kiritimatiellae bacterium]|nr:glycosyltransferase family 2 protein [Kiritimatiellia bacterium]
MTFSLIVATLGRTAELAALLDSLEKQTFRDFEVIVADQNEDARILPLLEGRDFAITRTVSAKGLSRARNAALPLAKGSVVAFPDDDCTYSPHTLLAVRDFFATHPAAGGVVAAFNSIRTQANRFSILKNAPSWAFFLRRNVVEGVGDFDESYGLGPDAAYKSAEDSDYLIRALAAGCRIFREPGLGIAHPSPDFRDFPAQKIEDYGFARMALLRKHGYAFWFRLANLAYPLARMLVSPGKAGYYAAMFRGRRKGFFA